jgi:RNA polymerase sigma factor (sigma-70 family)
VVCILEDFDEFFRAELPRLVRFLIHLGWGWEESRDAAAEAMLSAYQGWTEIEYPKAYVRTAAHRIAGHQHKRDQDRIQRSIQAGVVTPEQTDPYPILDDALDSLTRLTELLEKVPEKQRLVLVWHLDGFTNTEIADHMEIPPATVASHLRHAKRRVRRLLHNEQPPVALANEGGVHDDPS